MDVYEQIKDLYENTLQQGETFSHDIGLQIDKELERIYREREEWLEKQRKDGDC